MSIMDAVREGIRSFLRIEPALGRSIYIRETLDYQGNAIKNRIWYRGDGNELSQLYRDIADLDERYLFWASRSTPGMEMRKIHTGLPAVIVDTLSGIVVTNLNDFQFQSDARGGAVAGHRGGEPLRGAAHPRRGGDAGYRGRGLQNFSGQRCL